MRKSTNLLPLARDYIEQDPVAAACSLERMTEEEAEEVFRSLPPRLAAAIFPHLQVHYAATLLQSTEPQAVEGVVARLEASRAATVFMHLPPDVRERFLPRLPQKLKDQIHEQLTYPEDSVGRLMTTTFLAFHKDLTVRAAIARMRKRAQKRLPMSYVYVLGDGDRLVGVLNMHDLLLAAPDQTLESVMKTDVFVLPAFTDREDAAAELSRRRYFAAPVVDPDNRILGIIKAEQLISGAQEEVAEDIQTMFGVSADERSFSPLKFSLRKRLPWLHVNLLTAFMAAAVVALFEGTIARITVLAVFLPVVAGQGGNAGAQSLAIVMRGLVMREIPRARYGFLVFKESLLGIVTGAITGVVTAVIAWLWYGNPALGLVVGLGMIVNLFFAGMSGSSIPLLMKALRLDPAQCSSIILTTVTDVVGFFAFLGFAVVFQDWLV
jgi:magnesium transporter